MTAESSALDQLLVLRSMTITIGAMHEAQALQLRSYPTLIRGIKNPWTVDVNPKTKKVVYNLVGRFYRSELKTMKEISTMISKYILWPETKTEFHINKKKVF